MTDIEYRTPFPWGTQLEVSTHLVEPCEINQYLGQKSLELLSGAYARQLEKTPSTIYGLYEHPDTGKPLPAGTVRNAFSPQRARTVRDFTHEMCDASRKGSVFAVSTYQKLEQHFTEIPEITRLRLPMLDNRLNLDRYTVMSSLAQITRRPLGEEESNIESQTGYAIEIEQLASLPAHRHLGSMALYTALKYGFDDLHDRVIVDALTGSRANKVFLRLGFEPLDYAAERYEGLDEISLPRTRYALPVHLGRQHILSVMESKRPWLAEARER